MMDTIFLGFPPLPRALERIADLTEDQYDVLHAEVAGPEGLGCTETRLEQLTDAVGGIEESEIVDLLNSLSFLYARCREWDKEEEDDTQSALRSFLKATHLWQNLGERPEAGFLRLVDLLRPNKFTEQRKKLKWLRTGMFENAVEFSSFVDLRPDFSMDRMRVEGLVPVIMLRVRTELEFEEDRSHVFQLTVDGLAKLRRVLEDVDRKLDAVTLNEGLDKLIRKDHPPLEGTP